jgi:hypothetical protein
MNCQRCLRGEAVYRAHTDAMDIKICPVCAEEAQRLKIAIELLEDSEREADGAPRSSQLLNSFIE